MINIFNTKITPIVLLGNDLRQLWNNKQYHSGKILFGVINGFDLKTGKDFSINAGLLKKLQENMILYKNKYLSTTWNIEIITQLL